MLERRHCPLVLIRIDRFASTNTEMSTVHSDHGVFPVCTKEKESLTDVTFVNVDQEFHEEGNEKSETLTIHRLCI